ncbi:hypothetical protein [Halomonas sp. BC04]|nr:hypothetical protein [Halomonas sp. BC04]EWH00788.1 hypothetical protein Q427_17665 [Halomonas sp. BC04]
MPGLLISIAAYRAGASSAALIYANREPGKIMLEQIDCRSSITAIGD